MSEPLKAPFPWFGGKSRVAPIVWQRFGNVKNYVEPFFGSGAVLLGKPDHIKCIETINDKDAYVANFWRAIKHDPDGVAKWADNPVNENDLHARHIWLVQRKETLRSQVEGDPDYFDSRVAGYWVYGVCCWFGRDFCSGKGPWRLDKYNRLNKNEKGDIKNIDNLKGIMRQRIHCVAGDHGKGIMRSNINLNSWFCILSERLTKVRVCSGDWSRVMGLTSKCEKTLSGIFLDPPYTTKANRDDNLYLEEDKYIGNDVFDWSINNGDDPCLRIALCGYEDEYNFPDTWQMIEWKAVGGLGNANPNNNNSTRERIWFSPHCLPEKDIQLGLFDR